MDVTQTDGSHHGGHCSLLRHVYRTARWHIAQHVNTKAVAAAPTYWTAVSRPPHVSRTTEVPEIIGIGSMDSVLTALLIR